jgi:hypothetical protein
VIRFDDREIKEIVSTPRCGARVVYGAMDEICMNADGEEA